MFENINGYYDSCGYWQKYKFCFVYCGDKCDCGPPNNLYYDPKYDKRLEENNKKEET